MRFGAVTLGLVLAALAGPLCETSTAADYSNVGAREPGVVIADGQMCTFQYSGTPMTVADYEALPARFSDANGAPLRTEVTFLSEIAYVYGPGNGNSGGYGPGTDVSQNVDVGRLADVWDTQLDPGMAMCCQDLIISADAQGASFTVSGIGSGAFGASDEAVLFDKVQSCAMGAADVDFAASRLEGSGLRCSTTGPIARAEGEIAGECTLALVFLISLKTRRCA